MTTAMQDLRTNFADHLGLAAYELFLPYGIELSAAEGPLSDMPRVRDAIAGFIGFSGPHARGMIVIVTNCDVVRAAFPQGCDSKGATDLNLRDWIGELSNQLLGRVKNKLRKDGIVLQMSTPTAVTGDALGIADLIPGAGRVRCVFTSKLGTVVVAGDFEVQRDSVPMGEMLSDDGGMAEGEVALF